MKATILALTLAAPAAAFAAAQTYEIDPSHTHPSFEISHFGFSTYRGRFDKASGSITLDPVKKTGSVDVSIDVNSISTGVAKLDEHLKSPEFFDAAKYPAISFKGKDFRFEGDKLAQVGGELTMHGVTRPVTLEVQNFKCGEHPLKKVPACGADAVATIHRSDWGIKTYSPNVGEEVTLKIEVEAQAPGKK